MEILPKMSLAPPVYIVSHLPAQAGPSPPISTSQPSWVQGSSPSTTSSKPTLCWIRRYSRPPSCSVLCIKTASWAFLTGLTLFSSRLIAGRLLSGNQLRGWNAAAAHERRAGLRHAQVPHVRPRHQAAVQTGHGVAAGEREWSTWTWTPGEF